VGGAGIRADAPADTGRAGDAALRRVPGPVPEPGRVRGGPRGRRDQDVGRPRLQPARPAPAGGGRCRLHTPRRQPARPPRPASPPAGGWRVHGPGGACVRVRARRGGAGRQRAARPLADAGTSGRPALGRCPGATGSGLGVEPGGAGPGGHDLPAATGLRGVPGGRGLRLARRRPAGARPLAARAPAVTVRGLGPAGPRAPRGRAARPGPVVVGRAGGDGLAGPGRAGAAGGGRAGRRRPGGRVGGRPAATRRGATPGA
jgi:hypothetical protein